MATTSLHSFYEQIILIDDDVIHNMITQEVLKRFVDITSVQVIAFEYPTEGLDFLLNLNRGQALKTLVFLDINMPVLSGWDVLDRLTVLDEKIKENMNLYILSSSVDPLDKARAASYPLVKGFLSKPVLPHLESIFT